MTKQTSSTFEPLLEESHLILERKRYLQINRQFRNVNLVLWGIGFLLVLGFIAIILLETGPLDKVFALGLFVTIVFIFPLANACLAGFLALILVVIPFYKEWDFLSRCVRLFYINLTIGSSLMVLSMVFLLGSELL